MAKLAVLLATLALVLFLANASITTVTVDSEENPWGQPEDSCQQQIMKQNYLKDCQKYIEEKCSSSSYNSKHLDSCCEQLERLDRQCRCPGLKQAAMQQMQGEMGREEMEEMYQMADKIISKCDMEPRRCNMPYHTTIKLEKNTRRRQESSCEQQIKKQNYLKQCQKYMEEKCSSGSDNTSEHLDSCCEQLEKMDRQCRCPGLKQAVQQQLQEGQMGKQEMQEMYQMPDKIMSKCEMEPRRCDNPSRISF
ncbi:hypothetical protein REPUB_Repub05bG0040100 [Reevesia pubescens]